MSVGTDRAVAFFIETRAPSGGVTRDAWIARWGKPTRTALLRMTRGKCPPNYCVRIVRQSGEPITGWITV